MRTFAMCQRNWVTNELYYDFMDNCIAIREPASMEEAEWEELVRCLENRSRIEVLKVRCRQPWRKY